MINNNINSKILKAYNFINSDKYNNEFEIDKGFWCYDKEYLSFLYSELNLNKNSNIYLLKNEVYDIKNSDIIASDCFIEFYFNGNCNYSKNNYIIRNKKRLNIIYRNENIIIIDTNYNFEIFIFKDIQIINKLKMLITI